MGEPLVTMPLGDLVTGSVRDTNEITWGPRRMFSDVLLLQGPPGFDGVEVVRVGRQVDESHAKMAAPEADPRVLVGPEVVHDEDVASLKAGEELSDEPCHEAVLVRAGEHRAQQDPAAKAHGTEEGEVLPPVHGRPLDKLGTLLDPGQAPVIQSIDARLLE